MDALATEPVPSPCRWRPWLLVALLSALLAVCSLLSNIHTLDWPEAPMAYRLAVARWTVSLLLNTGTLWAGFQLAAGAIMARPLRGALAAVLAGEVALLLHYSLGRFLGIMGPDVWLDNLQWFIAAVLFGAPLGALGALWGCRSLGGLAARLLVPAGALAEAWSRYLSGEPPEGTELGTPSLVADHISGWIMVALGVVGIVWAAWSWRRGRDRSDAPAGA